VRIGHGEAPVKGGSFPKAQADLHQLRLVLWVSTRSDFCELSSTLMDREAKLVASTIYHNLVDLLGDETVCRSKP
jgi:hypothetical protein